MTKPTSLHTRKWILEGMQRVLKYRDVSGGVTVDLAGNSYGWTPQEKQGESESMHYWRDLPGKPVKSLPGRPPEDLGGKPTTALPDGPTERKVLRGLHRVLKYRDIETGVSIQLADQRYCWKCRTDAAGNKVCGWEPC